MGDNNETHWMSARVCKECSKGVKIINMLYNLDTKTWSCDVGHQEEGESFPGETVN